MKISPITKHIQDQLKPHLPKQIPHYSMFSKKSAQIIEKLIHFIYKADQSWTKASEKVQQTHVKQNAPNQFIKGPSYSYIPEEVRTPFEKQTTWQIQYEFILFDRKYNLICVLPTNGSKASRFFDQVLYKTWLWLHVLHHFAPATCSNQVDLYFYFTDHLKTLDNTLSKTPLDMKHVNTAFTTSCSPRTDIHLFRSEEWFKVFIHETFHNMGLDFSDRQFDQDNRAADQFIHRLFPVGVEVRLFETYCETWAELIHTVFFVYFMHPSTSEINLGQMVKKIEKHMQYEQLWSAYQCIKVLRHYGLTYKELTDLDCPRAKKMRETQYKENTFVLSYYVIKSVFLSNIDDFLAWTLEYNGRSNPVFFKKSGENVRQYCGLVATLYQDPWTLQILEHASKIQLQGHPSLQKSLRMTVHELI